MDRAANARRPFDTAPQYLLRDRDRIYGQEFRNQVAAMNIKEVLSAPRSPWQRAYVERVIGSIRRECLDHVIVFSEESLRRTLRSYFSYYHRSRLHLSLKRDSQESRPVQASSPTSSGGNFQWAIGESEGFPACGRPVLRRSRVRRQTQVASFKPRYRKSSAIGIRLLPIHGSPRISDQRYRLYSNWPGSS
jgi:hypothetical protein